MISNCFPAEAPAGPVVAGTLPSGTGTVRGRDRFVGPAVRPPRPRGDGELGLDWEVVRGNYAAGSSVQRDEGCGGGSVITDLYVCAFSSAHTSFNSFYLSRQ